VASPLAALVAKVAVVGGRGFASDAFRERIRDTGARPAIPPRRSDAPAACPDWVHAKRRLVENV
jgi:hypothetical protein